VASSGVVNLGFKSVACANMEQTIFSFSEN
jgi:hypothetical protein